MKSKNNTCFKCLIIDDEPLAASLLTNYVERIDTLKVENVFHNAIGGFNYLLNHDVDLIFLDIEMPMLKGIDFAKSLSNPPSIIFTTAYREYAVEGFELAAVDYLVKPIQFDRFLKAIDKFLSLIESFKPIQEVEIKPVRPHQFFKENNEMIKVYFDEILWIESMKDYVKINIGKRVITTYKRISHLEKTLPHTMFLRVHKSFIVSVDKISSYNYHHITIKNHEIPIGKSYRKKSIEIIKKSDIV